MPDDRIHDVSAMTDRELERARRHLMVSLSLAFPGSPVEPRAGNCADEGTELKEILKRPPVIHAVSLPRDERRNPYPCPARGRVIPAFCRCGRPGSGTGWIPRKIFPAVHPAPL